MRAETVKWSRSRGASHSRHGLAFWLVWAGVYGWIGWCVVSVVLAALRHLAAAASAVAP